MWPIQRHTCAIIMLFNQHPNIPHLSARCIILAKEKSSLTWIYFNSWKMGAKNKCCFYFCCVYLHDSESLVIVCFLTSAEWHWFIHTNLNVFDVVRFFFVCACEYLPLWDGTGSLKDTCCVNLSRSSASWWDLFMSVHSKGLWLYYYFKQFHLVF